jgi:hypothetical protein
VSSPRGNGNGWSGAVGSETFDSAATAWPKLAEGGFMCQVPEAMAMAGVVLLDLRHLIVLLLPGLS